MTTLELAAASDAVARPTVEPADRRDPVMPPLEITLTLHRDHVDTIERALEFLQLWLEKQPRHDYDELARRPRQYWAEQFTQLSSMRAALYQPPPPPGPDRSATDQATALAVDFIRQARRALAAAIAEARHRNKSPRRPLA